MSSSFLTNKVFNYWIIIALSHFMHTLYIQSSTNQSSIYIYIYIDKVWTHAEGMRFSHAVHSIKRIEIHFVRRPFSIAQSRVVRWRDDLTRLRFCLGSCIRNLTLGNVVQWLSMYFKSTKPLKPKSKNHDNGRINI